MRCNTCRILIIWFGTALLGSMATAQEAISRAVTSSASVENSVVLNEAISRAVTATSSLENSFVPNQAISRAATVCNAFEFVDDDGDGEADCPPPPIIPAPLPKPYGKDSCTVDEECTNTAVCSGGTCYAPTNRYLSTDPNPASTGMMMARRVSLHTDQGYVLLGWFGEPIALEISGAAEPVQYLSRIVPVPHYMDWNTVGTTGKTVHLGDCEISPGHQYIIQAIEQGDDVTDEDNYSEPLSLPTVAVWGDAVGSAGNPATPPQGVANLVDVLAIVGGFQGGQNAPRAWLDLVGSGAPDHLPDFSVVNIADVLAGVQAFQGAPTPFPDPMDCAAAPTSALGFEPGTWAPPPAALDEQPHASDVAGSYNTYGFNGEFHMQVVDLEIKGRGFDFVWSRKYRSRLGSETAQGNGWDFSYNIYIEQNGADRIVHDGNSRADTYLLQGDGTWALPEFFRSLEENPNGTYTLVFAHGGKWDFHALNGSPQAGKIATIVDRNGNSLGFDYDGLGRLVTVHDTLDTAAHNRDITIAYNAEGLIESVTDWTNRQVLYQYYGNAEAGGLPGDLKSVRSPIVAATPTGNDFPGGKVTTYTYTKGFGDQRLNHNLLTIVDPKGQEWLRNMYAPTLDPTADDFDHIMSQVRGDPSDVIGFTYVPQAPVPSNNFAASKAIVNDRVGNVRENFYGDRNELVMARVFTGRAPAPTAPTTDAGNRPVNPLRLNDPPFFETRYAYNEDLSLISILLPSLNETTFVYERDLNPGAPPRARGNLREIRRLPGPRAGDQAQIDEFFVYDPVINTGHHFVTRHVDARGSETLHAYDAAGNRTHTQHRIPSIVDDFEYNASGQITAHTHPDNGAAGGHRRRDEFTYYTTGAQLGYLKDSIIDAPNLALMTTLEYNSVGRVLRKTDPRGHDTQYVVNQLDQVVRRTSREVTDLGGVRYERDTYYDRDNNIVRVDVQNKDADGVLQANSHFTTVYEYEILNYRTRTCTESGEYAGVIPGTTDQPTCVGLPDGEFITNNYVYDNNRNLVLARSGELVEGRQADNAVRTSYDERDLVLQVTRGIDSTNPAASVSGQASRQYDYDGNKSVTEKRTGIESGAHITTLIYDGYDRPVSKTDAMGNQVTVHYDANGNTVSRRIDGEVLDAPGGAGNVRLREVTLTHDAMDRCQTREIEFFDTATQAPILIGPTPDGKAMTSNSWSDNSQLRSVTDDNLHTTTKTYDTANRRLTVMDAAGNTVTYGYNENSSVVTVTAVDKSDLGNPDEVFVTTKAYDNLERRIRRTDNVGNVFETLYDSRNNRTLVIDAMRPLAGDPGNLVRHTYDGVDRLIQTERFLTLDGTGSALRCAGCRNALHTSEIT